jgi:hypothetical protein
MARSVGMLVWGTPKTLAEAGITRNDFCTSQPDSRMPPVIFDVLVVA